jgi:hypothetical protein
MSNEAPILELQDFKNILSIIDYIANQGVLKGWDVIQQVFNNRNRYDVFIKYVDSPNEKEPPTLNLRDFQISLKIIDFAADEGALKGWSTIQQILPQRTRIVDFINYIESQNDQKTP